MKNNAVKGEFVNEIVSFSAMFSKSFFLKVDNTAENLANNNNR